jgi:hypothetical protein
MDQLGPFILLAWQWGLTVPLMDNAVKFPVFD